MSKKRRLDECSVVTSSVASTPCSQLEQDANKTRQLRNRESAERSRLKKDILVDNLTYQVLQCNLQIADLKEERSWLRQQQMMCCSSPAQYDNCSSENSVSSPLTSCDEVSDSDDSEESDYCSSPIRTGGPAFTATTATNASGCYYVVTPSSSSPSSMYSGDSSDDLLNSCDEDIDNWLESLADFC